MGKVSAEKLTGDFTKKIIKQIGLDAEVAVKETDEAVEVKISGENLGALIGYHGETLESLQLLVSLVLNKKRGEEEWKRVSLDIGNWKAERSEALVEMVEKTVAELNGQKLERISLPTMSASQRREVHVIVSEKFPDLATESVGEEPNRGIVLFKKS